MSRLCFSNETTDLFKALHKAQQAMGSVKRDTPNPFYKSKYATLESVMAACKEPLNENGIVITQAPAFSEDEGLEIITQLTHAESGQFMRSTLGMPVTKADAQGIGSATTYACRYSLMALLALPPTDDDAEGAVGRNSSTRKKSSAQAKKDGDWDALLDQMHEQTTPDNLKQWGMAVREQIGSLPDKWQELFREKYEAHMMDLRNASQGTAPTKPTKEAAE